MQSEIQRNNFLATPMYPHCYSGSCLNPEGAVTKEWQGNCYYFYKNAVTKSQADETCYMNDANVVSLNSPEEYDFVKDTADTHGLGIIWLSGTAVKPGM